MSGMPGRIYDRFDDTAEGRIVYVLPTGVLCSLVS